MVSFRNASFAEFYWNLNGNFWDIETDAYQAVINFPGSGPYETSEVNLYSGRYGEKDLGLASYAWTGPRQLTVKSKRTLREEEGITISAALPKDTFTPYHFTQEDERLYQSQADRISKWFAQNMLLINFGSVIVLLAVWFGMHKLWQKYGKDPNRRQAVAPEFSPPEDLPPLEMGLVFRNGSWNSKFVTAAIIDLATKRYLEIEKIAKANWFTPETYVMRLLKEDSSKLPLSERLLAEKLFAGVKEIRLADLKRQFYLNSLEVSNAVNKQLEKEGILDRRGSRIRLAGSLIFALFGLAVIMTPLILMVYSGNIFPILIISTFLTVLVIIVYLILMPRRTETGLGLYYRIRGFRLYIEKAEKYRAQFYEKENMFEKILPYAIAFGLTSQWIKAMESIYGQEFTANYAPAWLVGTGLHDLDSSMNGVMGAIEDVSSSISSASSPSNSGSSGGGFSGGGGGGGGGGGW